MPAAKQHGIEELTDFGISTIMESGQKALEFYGKGKPNIIFDEDLVTEAELHVADHFRKKLTTSFPQHQIFEHVEEDTEYTHDAKRYLWIFDPLDGAANFQAGIPIWGISLALIENFWPVCSWFYMPATGDLFKAYGGGKAYRGNDEIRVSSKTINDESVLLTYSRFHQHYKSTFPGKIRNLGCTAAHICYVAMGRADVAVIANESYQDLAAAQIIIESAGGKIFKMDGSPFYLNEHLDGRKIEDHLMVLGSDTWAQVKKFIQR